MKSVRYSKSIQWLMWISIHEMRLKSDQNNLVGENNYSADIMFTHSDYLYILLTPPFVSRSICCLLL